MYPAVDYKYKVGQIANLDTLEEWAFEKIPTRYTYIQERKYPMNQMFAYEYERIL